MDTITVAFRIDAPTPDQAKRVLDAIEAAGGVLVTRHHTHRPKRGSGAFRDGHFTIAQPKG
ncbi:hypothetical protein [Actinokineospora enzanensis]|uniref:hypothetical protein n=1 Tax=Actinokineospora enzanensis TaxID=155975 RepID=UPI000367B71F|nr:hypothetical protein [Actinokineospora enzanensis]